MKTPFALLIVVLFGALSSSLAAEPATPERVHRVTLGEYEATLRYWARKYAKVLEVDRVGESTTRLGIHLLKITDPDVDDALKQVALITSLHGGPERSGTTTVLHFVEWLMGDSEEARETRRKQIGFRLRLPYRHPKIDSVTVNGHSLKMSAVHGWQSWFANGFTQVQVNLPPEFTAKHDLFMISCQYTPDVVRRIGWTPPPEVVQQLNRK